MVNHNFTKYKGTQQGVTVNDKEHHVELFNKNMNSGRVWTKSRYSSSFMNMILQTS